MPQMAKTTELSIPLAGQGAGKLTGNARSALLPKRVPRGWTGKRSRLYDK